MQRMLDSFIVALNNAYNTHGVNAVARVQQIGHSGWYVFVHTEQGDETYVVTYENGQWSFIREFSI